MNLLVCVVWWSGGVMITGTASDSRRRGHGSWVRLRWVMILSQVFHTRASISKQYNLLLLLLSATTPCHGRVSRSNRITSCWSVAERNCSLPPRYN